jgi:hypothetical protein
MASDAHQRGRLDVREYDARPIPGQSRSPHSLPYDARASVINRLLPAELSASPTTGRGKRHSKREFRYRVKHHKPNEGMDIGKTRCERQKQLVYYTTKHQPATSTKRRNPSTNSSHV